MKATAIAPANIAFIKYWGKQENGLPRNGSISMTLDHCLTSTTVEFRDDLKEDEVHISSPLNKGVAGGIFKKISKTDGDKNTLLFEQIDRIRKLTGIERKAKVVSQNSFPHSAGLAASASGFAALTFALVSATGNSELLENKAELIRLIGESGALSAMRSVHEGFTEMTVENASCFTRQLAPADHWQLVDVIAIVDQNCKKISSLAGHQAAPSSSYFSKRLQELPERIKNCREAIIHKNFSLLGACMEADTLSMHLVAMTSEPPLYYWTKETLKIICAVQEWRETGLEAYFTIDAGANVHVLCREENAAEVQKNLAEFNSVQAIIVNRPGAGVRLVENHLF